MNIVEFEEFFFAFYRYIVFIGLGLLVAAAMILAMVTIFRAVNEA